MGARDRGARRQKSVRVEHLRVRQLTEQRSPNEAGRHGHWLARAPSTIPSHNCLVPLSVVPSSASGSVTLFFLLILYLTCLPAYERFDSISSVIMSATLPPLPVGLAAQRSYGCRASRAGQAPRTPASLQQSSRRRLVCARAEGEGSRAGKDDKAAAGEARSSADPLAGFEDFWKTGGFPHYLYSQARAAPRKDLASLLHS